MDVSYPIVAGGWGCCRLQGSCPHYSQCVECDAMNKIEEVYVFCNRVRWHTAYIPQPEHQVTLH